MIEPPTAKPSGTRARGRTARAVFAAKPTGIATTAMDKHTVSHCSNARGRISLLRRRRRRQLGGKRPRRRGEQQVALHDRERCGVGRQQPARAGNHQKELLSALPAQTIWGVNICYAKRQGCFTAPVGPDSCARGRRGLPAAQSGAAPGRVHSSLTRRTKIAPG